MTQRHRNSWDYVLRSGLAGGVAGCAVRMAADMVQMRCARMEPQTA